MPKEFNTPIIDVEILQKAEKKKQSSYAATKRWQSTEHGKKLKSFSQRIYEQKGKGHWERVKQLEEEREQYVKEYRTRKLLQELNQLMATNGK